MELDLPYSINAARMKSLIIGELHLICVNYYLCIS